MATLGDMIARTRRALGDPGGEEPLYSDELLFDGVLEALIVILPWVSKENTYEITGDGATFEFELPSDFTEVEAVWSESLQQFLPKAGLFPGATWLNGESSTSDVNMWLEYPHNYLSFSSAPLSEEIIKVFYASYWGAPEDEDDELEVPAFALPGIMYYTAAYCLTPKAAQSANVRQYGTKVDSGVPIHNPVADMAKFLLYRFEAEMNRCPIRQRGQQTR